MFRALFAGFLWLACSIAVASELNTISPGMDLTTAKATLEKYGYDYGKKAQLAMIASERDHALEFARIDTDITLIINHVPATDKIASLSVEIIPDYAPKLNRRRVSLRILAITFDQDGVYALKLKRDPSLSGKSQ